ncbi:MAG: hypothetical protein ACD_4C00343G0002 [uncultured bacterium (gcode 4)]|uniref:Guanylate cyclase domain-containing protein n=1 Tax=uncultured bacterium (gcode 4) TaxID=1234023 RepID=K2FWM5_9BACT|nr:MAG: hypothetical protein ACD_4C00343G0002 [uncultured bacterium (gcode 4)]
MNKIRDFINRYVNLNNKFFISVFISVSVILIIFLMKISLFGDISMRINTNFQNDLYSEKHSNNKNASPLITVIEIDDKTLKDKEKWWLWRWQDFKREYYAKIIDKLNEDWAIVIWIDVLFSEKSNSPNDDHAFSKSLKKAWNVILASHVNTWIYPVDYFLDNTNIWDIWPIVNRYNNMVYSIRPFFVVNGKVVESLGFSILKHYYSTIYWKKQEITKSDLKKDVIDFYDVNIPNDKYNKEFIINYIPNNKSFNKLSFVDVYNWKYNKELIRDKIILIWANAVWLHDEFNTPLGIMPWVYTHANVVNTILNKKVIHVFDIEKEFLVLILFIFIITFLWVYDSHKYYFMTSLMILLIGFFKWYQFTFTLYNTIFSLPVYFYISIFASFILVNLYRYIYEDKWKRILKNALSQYLAKDLVDTVLSDYKKLDLKWDKKEITIFFSDIEWFTNLSEELDPHELMEFLKKYLKEVSDIIIENKWFINKYEWDAVMALWWTFSNEKHQVYNSCIAALEQQKAIDKIGWAVKEKYWFDLKVRMWINKWDAIIWNIGSLWNKIEYTAIWDNVNLASRLESINKFYRTKICVSESVINETQNEFVFRKLDKIKVKWKKKIVTIYELIDFRNQISQELLDLLKDFEKWLELYFNKNFIEAKVIFQKLKNLWDYTSEVFIKRCDDLILNPIEDWDWSWEFKEK